MKFEKSDNSGNSGKTSHRLVTDQGLTESRRTFLKTVSVMAIGAAGATMLTALPGCKSPTDETPTPAPSTGNKVSFTLASEPDLGTVGGFIRLVFDGNNGGNEVIVERLAATGTSAFRTMSVVCTHQGCAVGNPSGGSVLCPCHGSRFGAAASNFAAVINGPATTPLQTFATTFDGTKITITF